VHRSEISTERRHPWWLVLMAGDEGHHLLLPAQSVTRWSSSTWFYTKTVTKFDPDQTFGASGY
jgi:hypothetical protein